MTVKEMIKDLLECNLESEVFIKLNSDQYRFTKTEDFKIVDYIGCVAIEEVTE